MKKMRVDKLLQSINVLRGDMSFVDSRLEWNELTKENKKIIN